MFGSQYMTNVSLIHKTPSEGPRCDWPDSPQVVTRMINIYSPAEPDSVHAAWQRRNALQGCSDALLQSWLPASTQEPCPSILPLRFGTAHWSGSLPDSAYPRKFVPGEFS